MVNRKLRPKKEMMKELIVLNTILPLFASFQVSMAIYNSYILEAKLQVNKEELSKAGLIYLLSEDKVLLQRMSRIVLILFLVANFLLCSWSISRILNDFAPYATVWITATAVIFHVIMALIAQGLYMIYKRSNMKFLRNFKI